LKIAIIRKKDVTAYVNLLDRLGVEAGSETQRTYRTYRDIIKEEEEEPSLTNNKLESAFEDLSLQDKAPNNTFPCKTMDSSSISTPPRPRPTVASPPLRTPGLLNRPDSVADSVTWNKSAHDGQDQGDGTKTKPFIINVNVEFPVRNGEFDIEWVPSSTNLVITASK